MKSFRRAVLIFATLMLVVAAATAQIYTDLYNFYGAQGAYPNGALAQGRDGNLYGTTYSAGANDDGVVFGIIPNGKLKVLYNFDGVHGTQPYSGLILAADGDFYGTTAFGGASGYGTIFKIAKNGTLTTLHSFTGNYDDGKAPFSTPIQGTNGNFFGASFLAFVAYDVTSSGTFLQSFPIPGQCSSPLILGADGNFYGTTVDGGPNVCPGGSSCGTVFQMTPKGVVTVIYNFDDTHGGYPYGAVIQGSDGSFYGTTQLGGAYGGGVAYRVTPLGAITVLHNFPDPDYPNDGSTLYAGLLQATDGNFYGVTESGGITGYGVIYQITLAGNYSVVYFFDGTHGANPLDSTLMQHTNGKIYGVAMGGIHGNGVFFSFDMGLGPFVRLASPAGKVGQTGGILGQGFTGTTSVSLNGVPAIFTVVSDTYIKATVPAGATTGYVTVTTPTGVLTSNVPFHVIP